MKKLFLITFGCQMNEYDSAKIRDLLIAEGGFVVTDDPNTADFAVLNTCAIREKATEKVFSELGRLRLIKEQHPHLVIAVGGCVAMEQGVEVFARAPYVNIVFGPQTVHLLPQMYLRALQGERKICDLSFPQLEKFDHLPPVTAVGSTAFVSIMEGCNNFCSYCIVPYTRGREFSRTSAAILQEVRMLLRQGVREIHLLGQNVNSYCDPQTKQRLATLIKQVAEFPEVLRIRFTTSHPADFDDELIETFRCVPQLANHLHLPIQSGSDRILKLMRRRYTYDDYCRIVEKLRAVRPDISLSTDIIVGFPGETEADFAATMHAVQEINFDTSFSFVYSARPHTPAARLPDTVPLTVKKKQLQILQQQLNRQAAQHAANLVGTTQEVLVTSAAKRGAQQLTGRTSGNKVVNFDAADHLCGQMVKVKIVQAFPNSLLGELVE